MDDWLPKDPAPSLGPREAADLPPELAAFIRPGAEAPAVLELYGPSDAAAYALAVRLARLARRPESWQPFRSCWIPVEAAGTGPELFLLKLLEQLLDGRPPTALYDMLRAEPEHLPRVLLQECRPLLTDVPRLVVLDGEADAELLRAAARLVRGTKCRVLALSGTRPRGLEPGTAGHRVPAGGGRAAAALGRAASALLDRLASWAGDDVDAELAVRLSHPEPGEHPLLRAAFHELCSGGLLRETSPGRYRLARPRPGPRHGVSSASLDRHLLTAALDGRTDLEGGAEVYADLAVRLLRQGVPDGGVLLDLLEPHLVGRQGLFRLLRMKQSLWRHTDGWEPLRTVVAVAVRETGGPLAAMEVLAPLATARAIRETAVAQRHAGALDEALATLDELPAATRPDGWALHTRAALLCDKGEPAATERLLRSAIEAHQVRGDVRGEAWAIHHYGRQRLIRGALEEARKHLETARHMFVGLGDRQGRAWSETELGRVLLLHGTHDEAAHVLSKGLGLHLSNQDVRGKYWTYVYLALVHAESGALPEAVRLVRDASRHFPTIPDQLGAAWARHFLAVLPWVGTSATDAAAIRLFDVRQEFRRVGCPHGEAWSMLELAELEQRETGRDSAAAGYAEARRLFELIGDESTRRWTRLLPQCPDTAVPLAGRPPLTARLTIPEPGADFAWGALLQAAHSHVRLTLHDEHSTAGTASRIALRIDPAPDHPWSTRAADLPWLTARATPLTAADVEPAHAVTLKPSPRDPDGAEFLFTPRRAGRHRLLFTIEHAATATVLQQVETYIDVTDGTGATPAAMLSPEALRRA
ncbi:hypothetical protein [Streptomyces sp. NPDC017940]|uniref:hypothetical protein n=1 Tax=Streptomyces sp. NPDC017940 TaxID=3365017 RepID=UPI00379116E8